MGVLGNTSPYCKPQNMAAKPPCVLHPREIWTHGYSEWLERLTLSRCLSRSLTLCHPFLQIRLNSRGLIYSVGLLLASVFVTVGLQLLPHLVAKFPPSSPAPALDSSVELVLTPMGLASWWMGTISLQMSHFLPGCFF